jgi:CubicO group peptidase (beta-lactamase class C family)
MIPNLMNVRHFPLAILWVLTAFEALPAQLAPVPSGVEMADRLDRYFERAAEFGFSGAVLLAAEGEILLHRGYGFADRAARIPLTEDLPLHIGSVGKQFTAAAILRLEADGMLSVDDRLERFFPDAPAEKRGITLHQLLSHTSGLPYLTTRSFMEVRSREEVVAEMLELPLAFEPGSRYGYSNPGYTLLAAVIERTSGETYEHYLERKILEPAGLRGTGFVTDVARWADSPMRDYPFEDSDGQPLSAIRPLPKALGAGSIVSTVADLYRWDRALQTDDVLPESSRTRMLVPAAPIQEGQHYGYGWMITRTPRNETLVHHAGDLGGYSTDLRRYVERDLVIVVTSNARHDGRGYRTLATSALAYLLNGQELLMPPAVLPGELAGTSALAGEFRVGVEGRIRVSAQGRGLMIGGTGEEVLLALGGASDSDALERSRDLSERAAAIAGGLASSDAGPLQEHLHENRSFTETRDWLLGTMENLVDSLGEFRRVENLGTAVLTPSTARSYVDLIFERGRYSVMYGWQGEKIIDFASGFATPMEQLFLPTGPGTFAYHDLFTGRTVDARFGAGTLTIAPGSSGEPLTASRTQSSGQG